MNSAYVYDKPVQRVMSPTSEVLFCALMCALLSAQVGCVGELNSLTVQPLFSPRQVLRWQCRHVVLVYLRAFNIALRQRIPHILFAWIQCMKRAAVSIFNRHGFLSLLANVCHMQ